MIFPKGYDNKQGGPWEADANKLMAPMSSEISVGTLDSDSNCQRTSLKCN